MSRNPMVYGLCAILSLAACSDFTSSGDPLNQAEAGELAGVIVGQGFAGIGGAFGAPAAVSAQGSVAAAPAERITININDSGPCEGGGTVSLAGSLTVDINQQAGTGSLQYDYTLTPSNCSSVTETGKTFILTGDPRLDAEGELSYSSTGFQGSLNYDGKFKWEHDGRAGVCGVDLSAEYGLAMEGEGASGSITVNGSICGISVNRSLEYES